MVLQQAPAKSAVYGMAVGNPTSVKVTVRDEDAGTSYAVAAVFNTTHQPFGPAFVGGRGDYTSAGAYIGGPHTTWKAFLKPTAAGGNYTITATCEGCYEDLASPFASVNISDVVFGDVWHCSGQSNMWLPVSSAFAHNDTLAAIAAGKYHNIRVMAGNSGDCPGEQCPWMTAAAAAVPPPQQGRTPSVAPLLNFGAACWYFAQKLADELEAAGSLVPLGMTDTAIGGQRIEEYGNKTEQHTQTPSVGNC